MVKPFGIERERGKGDEEKEEERNHGSYPSLSPYKGEQCVSLRQGCYTCFLCRVSPDCCAELPTNLTYPFHFVHPCLYTHLGLVLLL